MDCGCRHSGEEQSCIELVPIFCGLNREEMIEIENITYSKTYQKGEMIYMAGEEGDKLFIIHKGSVKITRYSETGREQVIRVLGPGDFMGELSLFTHGLLVDNAQALEHTEVCIVDGDRLKELMMKYPTIAVKILEEMGTRLGRAEKMIENLGLYNVEARIARTILDLADDDGRVVLNLSKQDLASHTGMTQETLSRKLSHFQNMGWIKLEGQRKIIILDKESLASLI
ncbi:MAG: Crp/Fnr family transcriptional regulator [Clostridiales bacterium]|jgi:CRP-like cAMP-binding protein|nr:Crp/Fnr family transcriptional regulator [Clostridiales bacterium]